MKQADLPYCLRRVQALVRYRELGTPRLKGLRERQPLFEILG